MKIEHAIIATLSESELTAWHSGLASLQWLADRERAVRLRRRVFT